MLEIKNLTKRLKGEILLKNVEISIKRGKLAVLLGRNGVGKTTLLKCISNLISYNEGKVDLHNRKLSISLNDKDLLIPKLTVEEYLKFVCSLHDIDKQAANRRIKSLLNDFCLENDKNKLTFKLSKGNVAKLSMISCLVVNPEIILLDEPFSGMDIETTAKAIEILNERRSNGATILISTHNLDEIFKFCDSLFQLKDNKVSIISTLNDISSVKNILRNYILLFSVILLNIIVFILSKYLVSNELVYEYYIDIISQEQINELLDNQGKWQWLSYVLIPLIVIMRSVLVSMCLSVGLFFYDSENNIKYKKLLNVALLGEFILASVGYVKFFYFTLVNTNYSLVDIQQFYPLSFINFLDVENLEPWLVYPLQTVNLFEITYFFVLVYGMHKLLKNNYWKSFEITAASYGTGLLIWLGFVMFLMLNIS
jgi:ABC-type multidrug transport system ATPase subunit